MDDRFSDDGGPSDGDVYRLLRRSVQGVDDFGDWYVVDEQLTGDGWLLSFQDRAGTVSHRRVRIERGTTPP